MKKDKRQKTKYVCFLIVSICFYCGAVLSFVYNNVYAAVLLLALGSTFLALSAANSAKKGGKSEKDK